MPSPPVRAPNRTDLVAGAGGERQLHVLFAQHADAQRVDERVAGVGRVEHDLAADVGQAQAVAVAADAGDDPGQHAAGVGGVGRAEAQRVHHGDRARAHRQDVADDAADAGGRALVGLDVGRVVVRLDLEGHRPAVADVDHAGVLADARRAAARISSVAFSPNCAGAPSRTCRSSARSTSPSTSPARRGFDQRRDHRAEPGDRAGAQVVAVREARREARRHRLRRGHGRRARAARPQLPRG
jgi:hypothetical protein